MKTLVWTYKKKKPTVYKVNRFYFIKNEKQYESTIQQLLDLDIDVVIAPADFSFPIVLEMQSGFALVLKRANVRQMRKEFKSFKKLMDKVEGKFK